MSLEKGFLRSAALDLLPIAILAVALVVWVTGHQSLPFLAGAEFLAALTPQGGIQFERDLLANSSPPVHYFTYDLLALLAAFNLDLAPLLSFFWLLSLILFLDALRCLVRALGGGTRELALSVVLVALLPGPGGLSPLFPRTLSADSFGMVLLLYQLGFIARGRSASAAVLAGPLLYTGPEFGFIGAANALLSFALSRSLRSPQTPNQFSAPISAAVWVAAIFTMPIATAMSAEGTLPVSLFTSTAHIPIWIIRHASYYILLTGFFAWLIRTDESPSMLGAPMLGRWLHALLPLVILFLTLFNMGVVPVGYSQIIRPIVRMMFLAACVHAGQALCRREISLVTISLLVLALLTERNPLPALFTAAAVLLFPVLERHIPVGLALINKNLLRIKDNLSPALLAAGFLFLTSGFVANRLAPKTRYVGAYTGSPITEWIKENTSPAALFVVPPDFWMFRQRSGRSAVADLTEIDLPDLNLSAVLAERLALTLDAVPLSELSSTDWSRRPALTVAYTLLDARSISRTMTHFAADYFITPSRSADSFALQAQGLYRVYSDTNYSIFSYSR